ncbi:MAG: sensor histidine kinase [Gemmatimonadaceae bacterium]
MMISRKRAWAFGVGAAFIYAAAQTFQIAAIFKDVPVAELYLYELPVWLGVIVVSPIVFWLARRLPLFGPRAGRNFLAHLAAGTVVLLLQFVLIELTRRVVITPLVLNTIASTAPALKYAHLADDHSVLMQAWIAFRIYVVFFLFVYFAAVVLHHSVRYHEELSAERLHAQELQTLLARSQLDSLRLQLHPHFLFNTLNTVSSLMTRDVALARRTLARLSDLLRQTLSDSATHEVSLAGELEFLAAYVDIQSARFGPRLVVEKQIQPAAAKILVPRMLLQPLVENSIHHGMRDGDSPLVICIEAVVESGVLELKVIDNGVGLRNPKLIENVGLRNTRERLERLYGTAQEMRIEATSGEGFCVVMRLPARAAEEPPREQLRREIA